ncbi:hypothetical protein [Ruegeria sp. HKCCD6157]|uniref:hypothetical protein n=1 Tax=Ruegeria sp. HKCCD6157 TaxID=2690707 RepID=UPI00149248AF|nr:hypothetical protein [Ruegeria sp. HKCCD6157]NOE27579.1 hypothetical protein [Ruegeria sp. HKCCD6157]
MQFSIWLPFLGAIIGASIPVLLGALFYSSQKRADRREQLHDEKRHAYRNFLKCLQQLGMASLLKARTPEKELSQEITEEALTALFVLQLYAPDEIADSAGKLVSQAIDLTLEDRVFAKDRRTLTKAMRADLSR